MSSIFRRIMPGWVLEDAVTDTIKTWIDTYLAEVADQWGSPTLPGFRSYNVRPSGERWTEDQLPSLIVVNAGLDSEPRKSGEAEYEADFRIGLIIMVVAPDARAARQNMETYTAACRAILLQKRGLGIGASSISWASESYDEVPDDAGRTMGGGVVEFVITVPSVVTGRAGPVEPTPVDPVPPGTEWPQVETVDLEVDSVQEVTQP
jgi:hypothetical protein